MVYMSMWDYYESEIYFAVHVSMLEYHEIIAQLL